MATEIIEFPFDSGVYEAADRAWLPENLFAVVENMRLDRDGRLGIRPGNTQQGNSVYQGGGRTLTAQDLANYNGRLVALGDADGGSTPTDLYELIGTGTGAEWRATAGNVVGIGRLPRATNVRELGRIPDQASSVQNVQVAVGAGFVCAVHNLFEEAVIHVFDPADDQTILLAKVALDCARVVFAGSDFWIVGQNPTNDDIQRYNFDPVNDTSLSSVATVSTAPAGDVQDIAVCNFSTSDWVVVWAQSTTTTAHRLNSSGTVQATWSVAGGDFRALAAASNAAGTLIGVLSQRGADGEYRFNTYNSAGTLQSGPTTVFGGAAGTTETRAGMCQSGIGTSAIMVGFEDSAVGSTKNLLIQEVVFSSHALGSVTRYRDALPTSHPICPLGSIHRFGAAVNYMAGTNLEGTNQFWEQVPNVPVLMKDGTLAGQILFRNDIGGTAAIGTKVYWGNTVQGNNGSSGTVTEFDLGDGGRRQMAQVANELHIAGGLPTVYDGRNLVEQCFAERPSVRLSEGTTGALTLLGRYFVRATWEVIDARGNLLRSAASDPVEQTLTGANDSLDVVVSTPHSLRLRAVSGDEVGQSIRVGVYRTIAGGANFILDRMIEIPAGHGFGQPVTVTLTRSDASLQTAGGGVLYEQSQTPISHVAPPPYKYAWPARERMLIGGLPYDEQWQMSKLLFPNEPVEFANQGRLGFGGRANRAITAVGAFENVGITWTADEIQIIPGRGPEHSGVGEFDSALLVASPGGCRDWRSLVNAPPGFFFQMTEDKLMLLARGQQGAGEVSWVGQPVRETLALFPVITGAVHIRTQMAVVFSCTNTGGTDGRLLIFDLRRGVWYVDTVGPVTAVSELNGRLAYVSDGDVFLQDAAAGVGTFPGAAVQTGFIPVTKRLGWGMIHRIGLYGIDAGACTVQCLIDADDGQGLRDLGTETFTGTGNRFERFWSIPTAVRKLARFSVRFVVQSVSSNTLGVQLAAWAAEVQGSPNMVRVGSGGMVQ